MESGAIHLRRRRRHTAENIAAADHHAHLHAHVHHFFHLADNLHNGVAVNAEGIFAHQRFAGKFEEDA